MPALYATLTVTLVVTVAVVASVVRPATPPSIAELGPAPQERIEQARQDQAAGTAPGATGPNGADRQGPGPPTAPPAGPDAPTVAPPAPPAVEVPATRRCFGDPPRQTEDPHSPPCVFEIFTDDNGGATAPGVTTTEIRVAVPTSGAEADQALIEALVNHFNRRYEFYGRRLTPVFVPFGGDSWDPANNRALADELIATEPLAVSSTYVFASNAVIYPRLAQAGVISAVSGAPGFDSGVLAEGLAWSVDPPLDVRLRAGARLVCRAFSGRPASHAGADVQATTSSRRFAVVVLTEPAARPDHGPLENGLHGCGSDFESFDAPFEATQGEYETLMLQLKTEGFTTVLPVSSGSNVRLYQAASEVGYFPEWMDLGVTVAHSEFLWADPGRSFTGGHGEHAFGFTPKVRVRPEAEVPALWALREGGGTGSVAGRIATRRYEPLLVLASGIQGAGPNLTPETFAQALRTMDFPNPNPGAPPYWQQGVGFGPGDPVFHDDYAIWWWNDNAPSQTSESSSGRGSFCYLDRGARFTAETLPADADARLFSASEACR